MKTLLIILGIAGGLVVLFLIVAALLPSKVRFARTATVTAAPDTLYSFLLNFGNQARFNPWLEKEPAARQDRQVTSNGIGSSFEWQGKEIGHGKLTHQQLQPGQLVQNKLQFFAPFKAVATDTWALQPVSGGTQVTWQYDAELDYPMGRVMGLMLEGMMAKDYEKGLANLKRAVEG
jgi:ribosome-associated toxin RatA of RatAB toxin-antitoxin module